MVVVPDIRCKGASYEEDGEIHWREGCEDCLRRLDPPDGRRAMGFIQPPAIIAFECEYRIADDARQ